MHEVECVLLKEANIADPLEIAGGTPDLFIEDITNEQEEDEGSSLSIPLVEEILKPRRQKKEKEVVREEDLVAACDICFKRFRSGYGKYRIYSCKLYDLLVFYFYFRCPNTQISRSSNYN